MSVAGVAGERGSALRRRPAVRVPILGSGGGPFTGTGDGPEWIRSNLRHLPGCCGFAEIERLGLDRSMQFPSTDGAGNALVGVQVINESELPLFESRLPMPLSLVVVVFSARVLLMFNRWRGQWELPGGMRELGEAPRQAAVRELDEETGIAPADLHFALVAEFWLQRPSRREYAAVYRTSVDRAPVLRVNDEASAFQWWEQCSSIGEHMSPLDTQIARHVYSL